MTPNQIVLDRIWAELSDNKHPQTNPIGYVLGGQPGAGKSRLTEILEAELEAELGPGQQPIVINGDEFRSYHPDFANILLEHGDDWPKHTADFSAQVTEKLIEHALLGKYNVIIEGTFRTSEVPIRALQALQDYGYESRVAIQTCSKEESWASVIFRYNTMKASGRMARMTPQAHHDWVVNQLPNNADVVFLSGLAKRFRVYDRQGIAYDSASSQLSTEKSIYSTLHQR